LLAAAISAVGRQRAATQKTRSQLRPEPRFRKSRAHKNFGTSRLIAELATGKRATRAVP
jgi:hypothetical protein